ncbi:hypothetical protein TVAG_059760 [Trichomonas vaginalis G3]|uniref:Protein kinase domain-containing protein n=1 Tax=Trichomonas vaginalis (strain ATCC PRA-98 / G3) TaxID=412133 RepID=A2FB28_TRIV3|nr:hypothetical protein TVAG_059760 [Trichomonas vaginalis G3]|eukprot:XP_001310841.1 hypothetical protein [Trichomonas vaginalis G3]
MSNHPDKKPTIASYKIVRFIGSGLHSSVLEVQNINDGKRYAAKRYSNKLIEDKSEQLEKIKTLVGVKLLYVCPIVDVFQEDESTDVARDCLISRFGVELDVASRVWPLRKDCSTHILHNSTIPLKFLLRNTTLC